MRLPFVCLLLELLLLLFSMLFRMSSMSESVGVSVALFSIVIFNLFPCLSFVFISFILFVSIFLRFFNYFQVFLYFSLSVCVHIYCCAIYASALFSISMCVRVCGGYVIIEQFSHIMFTLFCGLHFSGHAHYKIRTIKSLILRQNK